MGQQFDRQPSGRFPVGPRGELYPNRCTTGPRHHFPPVLALRRRPVEDRQAPDGELRTALRSSRPMVSGKLAGVRRVGSFALWRCGQGSELHGANAARKKSSDSGLRVDVAVVCAVASRRRCVRLVWERQHGFAWRLRALSVAGFVQRRLAAAGDRSIRGWATFTFSTCGSR